MRVLALNDDNHEVCFTTETGVLYYNARHFITECLGLPHEIEYDVRGFCICDNIKGGVYSQEDIELIFTCVESGSAKVYDRDITFAEAFDLLWNSSSVRW